MSLFEEILQGLLITGQVLGPVFIHSQHGVAILNASQEGTAAILQAHAQAQSAKVQQTQTSGNVTIIQAPSSN